MKEIKYSTDARLALSEGITKLAEAVGVTLGPQGRNVFIKTAFKRQFTKDGVTVAKQFELEDHNQNEGAKLVIEVASKTDNDAGDGTTTATILTQAIVSMGMQLLAAGMNPMDVKKGIDIATKAVLEELENQAVEVDDEGLIKIATISANNDVELGKMIGETFAKVGKDGIVTVEDSNDHTTHPEVVNGLRFDNGLLSPYFMTNPDKQHAELHQVNVVIYNGKLNTQQEILPIMQETCGLGKTLLLLAEDVQGEALKFAITNRLQGDLGIAIVKTPGFGSNRLNMLEDLAVMTGATVLAPSTANTLENFSSDVIGQCSTVTSTLYTTTVVGGEGTQDSIDARVHQLMVQRENETDEYQLRKLSERIAKLKNGVGVIYVGGVSEAEQSERKDRVVDAVSATKAASQEGTLIGGGVALVNASTVSVATENEFQKAGANLLLDAIKKPLMKIAENAGVNGEVVLDKVIRSRNADYGYNAKTGNYTKSMTEDGILDPKKVTRIALENAASIAGMVLTTECSMVYVPAEGENAHIHNF